MTDDTRLKMTQHCSQFDQDFENEADSLREPDTQTLQQ